MAPVKTRSGRHGHWRNKGEHKADPEDDNDDDFYGMRELKHQLASLNLKLKDTLGDGNCLFRALADQYTGSDADHYRIRQDVCTYIEEHADHFKLFLDNQTVEAHVAQMRRNATYGGNVELVAFARLKRVDIRVYQPGYVFVIEGVDVKKEGSTPGQRPMLHIAWEHYSSIRNIDGPFEGLPEINPRPVEQPALRKLSNDDPPRPIEKTIMKVTGTDDLQRIRDLMEKHKGDVDRVYEEIYEVLNQEDSQDNSGSEKDEDEDEEPQGSDEKKSSKKLAIAQLEESGEDESEKDGVPSEQPLSGKAKRAAKRIARLKEKRPSSGKHAKDDEERPATTDKDSDKGGEESTAPADKASPPSLPSTPTSNTPSSRPNTPLSRDSSPVPELVPIRSTVLDEDDSAPTGPQGSRPSTPSESTLPSELTTPVVPKKRYMSSREKKELAKRNQKLNRKNRGKQPSPTPSSGSDGGSVKSSGSNISGLRELYV
ncbi:hypothetical protein BGZ73_004051 [Actinomortierella ambigua]|nr:hypothetical protein BGZ73_004051 [Actinomortierella ambigua]